MKIMQQYYIKEFLKVLGIIAFGMALIFSLIDLIEKIDNFLPDKISLVQLVQYIILNFPKYLYYLLPMSLLICSLFIFSQASRHKELTVIKATGGKLKRLLSPFIVLGILFSLFGFVIGEFVIPDFSNRNLEFKKAFMKGSEKYEFSEGTIWLRAAGGAFIRIGLYIPETQSVQGMSIFIMKDAALKERIEAEKAFWVRGEGSKGTWRMRKVTLYDIDQGEVRQMEEMDYPNMESPEFFSRGIRNPEDMGIRELQTYMKRLKRAGFEDAKLEVDLNAKISYPSINLFMILLGISLSLMGRFGGGLFAAGLGLSVSFVYWLIYTFVLSLGYAKILPPFAATWVVPILFGTATLYLFRKIPE